MYMDGYLKHNLDILKKNIIEDWDFWIVIDGLEGSGKSTFAMQICKYLDPSFNIGRVCFSTTDFEQAIDKAEKYQAVLWDESIMGSESIDMNRMAKSLKKKAVQCRQRNLFIVLVIHSYFEMKKYYAVHRTWFLLHTYHKANEETEKIERGFFSFYDFQKKKLMYCNDKTRKNYSYYLDPNFRGSFTKEYVIDKDAYLEKKSAIRDQEEEGLPDNVWAKDSARRGVPVSIIEQYTPNLKRRQIYYIKEKVMPIALKY